MNAVTLVFTAILLFTIGYRFYGLFIATRVLGVDVRRPTPAERMADGHDYVKTNKYVLFGHHFAAISAAGPLLGPVLAAQFGFLPGALWILIGAVLAGAVHDMVILFASVRHNGRSLPKIAEHEIGKTTGHVASVAVLFILILAMAGLSIAMVNALYDSVWGTFTVFSTIPIAVLMGLWMQKIRPGDVVGASVIGVVLLLLAVVSGPMVAQSPLMAGLLSFSKLELSFIIPVYGFMASALPVWLLLAPRDYLSSYLKIGTIFMLVAGIFIIQPDLQMPALTEFIHGGGPIIQGPVFPFIFITIACGALSGFHAVVSSGTSPKMIASEKDILFVGYGAMLMEGLVAIMALVAACVLMPADYFAINSSAAAYAKLGMAPVALPEIAAQVGETLQARPGGAVSLAVGMAYIFSSLPYMETLMAYWYHFAIMFEAVFILTAIDAGTRIGRFLLQEMIGAFIPKFKEPGWIPGIVAASFLFTVSWGYFVVMGNITTIWPVFGMSNQLLASIALTVGTTMIIRMGKARYAWITGVPAMLVAFITLYAGYLTVTGNFLPNGLYFLSAVSIVIMLLATAVITSAVLRWADLLKIKNPVRDEYGEMVLVPVAEE
ncbi:MAG: carbon starvation protein A [Nitrospinota bacterium]|nr:carbon starvation protein A [Nitrospinota bacterium]MDH5755252.1 carbon starvation protein A [Nitrospinota bacterium]